MRRVLLDLSKRNENGAFVFSKRQKRREEGMGWQLRIMMYNAHSCFGTDRKLDPGRIADHLSMASHFHPAEERYGDALPTRPVKADGPPSRLPLLPIDHIFIGGGITARRTFVHDTPLARRASDHLPLCAVLGIA
jgi:endonuclease/exonuclease/phosphatase family metal-dependent hydrolase